MRRIILGILIFVLLLILIITSKKSIIGKWKSIDSKDEYYYIFNKDKTCSYEMKNARLDCTYEVDDNNVTIKYKGNTKSTKYQYKLEKKKLIIKDSSGKNHSFTESK